MTTIAEMKKAKAAKAVVFSVVRLPRIVRGNGSVFLPVGGVYIPTTEEETELCKYYASTGRLIEGEAEAPALEPLPPTASDLE